MSKNEINDGCVRFKKTSWHYKVVNYIFPYYLRYKTVNLCPYLRKVIASVILLPFILLWRRLPYGVRVHDDLVKTEIIFLFLVMGFSLMFDFMDTYKSVQDGTPEVFPPFLDMVAIGFFGGNAIGVVGGLLIYGVFALHDYIKKRPKIKNRTTGLLKTYVKSKHEKICPCVEFEDDKK